MIDLKLSKDERKNLSEDEIEIAMARKLEILILPIVRRNLKFFYAGGDLKGKAKAYRENLAKDEIQKVLETRNGNIATVCKPFCETVAEILNDNGITAETVSCDTDMFKHTDVLITTKNGKKYIINYLEDMENIQSKMKTPDFASQKYYERRYKKFENGLTTDGKDLKGISFLTQEELAKIDTNLGYKKYGMYMDDVIQQIKNEFSNFREVMADNTWIAKQAELEKKAEEKSFEEKEKLKKEIFDKYKNMTKEEETEAKLDWLFSYFNDRMDIKGHADFVMYYSRLLLKEVLTEEEYRSITRYDCYADTKNIPKDSKIKDILDSDNPDNSVKSRFCMIDLGNKLYAFSTKPNSYIKLDKNELEELEKYANISKTEKPSDLMLYLCDRGNALPLVFHPLGSKLLNERAELIDKDLNDEDRKKAIEDLSNQIQTTDEPVTSILIPYPDGEQKYIYINEDDEFVLLSNGKETIYHYNEENDTFDEEIKEKNEEER